MVPCPLEVPHALQHVVHFFVAHQAEDGGVDARAVGVVRRIVATVDASQRLARFARSCTGC